MNKLKIKLYSLALGLTVLPIMAAKAQTTGGVTPVAPPTYLDIPGIINRVMNWAFGLLIVLAAAFIFFAAYLYLTAGGNEEKLKGAKNYIIYAVVAIIIGFVARGLVSIIIGLLQ